MMKSEKFEVGLLDQYHLYIPKEIFQPFVDAGHRRVKIKAFHHHFAIELYAAVKKDKVSGDFIIMFSKRYQKELGIFQNDYFEIQLFEDTSKYGVDVPEELNAVLLSDHDAYKIFETLTRGAQRSIIYTIIRIKNSQSRIDKSIILCGNLKRGVTSPMALFKTE
ncbi:MAG TPA: YdeI/OmpD-associated family protein [Aquaticitalea sp.]|nr:YdeI/OmpD-associated family protein [Aquaticitalea sp.]